MEGTATCEYFRKLTLVLVRKITHPQSPLVNCRAHLRTPGAVYVRTGVQLTAFGTSATAIGYSEE